MRPLLLLVGAVLCSTSFSAEVSPQANFHLREMKGKWFLIGIASNGEWFVRRKDTMKMGVTVMMPTPSGDLEMNFASLSSDGSCWRKEEFAKKTDVPGKFTYDSQRWGSSNDMSFVDVKYDEHALVYILKTTMDEVSSVTKLYGRNNTLSDAVVDKFKQFSSEMGIAYNNTVVLPLNGECSVPNK